MAKQSTHQAQSSRQPSQAAPQRRKQKTFAPLAEPTRPPVVLQAQAESPLEKSIRSRQENPAGSMPAFTVQPKLTIGQPNDKYEQEADNTARQVVREINSPGHALQQKIQAQMQTLPLSLVREGEISREGQAIRQKVQAKILPMPVVQGADASTGGPASAAFESQLNRARSGGTGLEPGLQRSMGEAMGVDFSPVKVHTDSTANALSQSIQAKAFTTGPDIFFKRGAYNPGSRSGQELIAHELTHTVQQGAVVRRKPSQEKTVEQLEAVLQAKTLTQGQTIQMRPGLNRFKPSTLGQVPTVQRGGGNGPTATATAVSSTDVQTSTVSGNFPTSVPGLKEKGDALIEQIIQSIEKQTQEPYKIEIGYPDITITTTSGTETLVNALLEESELIADYSHSIEEDEENEYRELAIIKAKLDLEGLGIDPLSSGQIKVSGDFNGTPNPPLAEDMYKDILWQVEHQLIKDTGYYPNTGYFNAEFLKSTQKLELILKSDDKNRLSAFSSYINGALVGNVDVSYKSILNVKKFYTTKTKKDSDNEKGLALHISFPLLNPVDWPDIGAQTLDALSTVSQADAIDVAKEQITEDNAYTIFDRFKMIWQVIKGETEDVPDTVSELIGDKTTWTAWLVPGLGIVALLKKFLDIRKYGKRRKGLEEAFQKSEKEITEEDVDKDKQERLKKLQEGLTYGISKIRKLIITLWVEAIASIVQVVSRILTLLFPQIAVGTIFVDVAATATKLGSVLLRKGKGFIKYLRGTRGKKRYESAESIFNSALAGDDAGVAAIRALNIKTIIQQIGTVTWAGVKKLGKGAKTLVTPGDKATMKLNKLDKNLSQKGKDEMQWGQLPSLKVDLMTMLSNVNQISQARLVFIKNLSNELKSSK